MISQVIKRIYEVGNHVGHRFELVECWSVTLNTCFALVTGYGLYMSTPNLQKTKWSQRLLGSSDLLNEVVFLLLRSYCEACFRASYDLEPSSTKLRLWQD